MLTFKYAKSVVRGYGLTIRKTQAGDYRISIYRPNNPSLCERLAYYTDDLEDAMLTARAMSEESTVNDIG